MRVWKGQPCTFVVGFYLVKILAFFINIVEITNIVLELLKTKYTYVTIFENEVKEFWPSSLFTTSGLQGTIINISSTMISSFTNMSVQISVFRIKGS